MTDKRQQGEDAKEAGVRDELLRRHGPPISPEDQENREKMIKEELQKRQAKNKEAADPNQPTPEELEAEAARIRAESHPLPQGSQVQRTKEEIEEDKKAAREALTAEKKKLAQGSQVRPEQPKARDTRETENSLADKATRPAPAPGQDPPPAPPVKKPHDR